MELRLLIDTEPSATPFSTAAPMAAAFAAGEKVELFLRLMRCWEPIDPFEAVWEWERL